MKTFTITITNQEEKALSYIMASPEEWTQNAITERARIASEELVARETARMIADPNITTIPATADEIIMAAEPYVAPEAPVMPGDV
jgi:hypothetical protein